jgi:hypothetical protein
MFLSIAYRHTRVYCDLLYHCLVLTTTGDFIWKAFILVLIIFRTVNTHESKSNSKKRCGTKWRKKNRLELEANLKIQYQHSFTPPCIAFCKTYERGNSKCNIHEKVKVY